MTRQISEINVHCSATRTTWFDGKSGPEKVAEIKRWHVQENGWRDIGYHYIIDRDGKVYKGRPVDQSGAFEPKVNANAVGVCLLGGFGSTPNDQFSLHYTAEQDEALRKLIVMLRKMYPAITKVTGHNDYSPKACPGFRVGRWLDGKPERSFTESKTAVGSASASVAAVAVAAVEVVQQAPKPAQDDLDLMKLFLIGVVVAGALWALWSRWSDWKAGRK